MAFDTVLASQLSGFPDTDGMNKIHAHDVEKALLRHRHSPHDLPVLLSTAADPYLEEMARRARDITRRHFGSSMLLFTPLYISNYCDNHCRYCSFASQRAIVRRHLAPHEIAREAAEIASTGMRHILLLTGESRGMASPAYLEEAVTRCRPHFSSIGIEVYPLTGQEYGELIGKGVDALTIYQETYDRAEYARLHTGGPKQEYDFRLQAPERASAAGIHAVTIGPLLGLCEPIKELYAAALHCDYLQHSFSGVEVGLSFPRLRPLAGTFQAPFPVNDRMLVKIITAFRIIFPSVGITLSTREMARLRNNLAPLGVTRMSAGVSTAVGSHSASPSTAQFEIADHRSLDQMCTDLQHLGFQPVLHDWSSRLFSDNSQRSSSTSSSAGPHGTTAL